MELLGVIDALTDFGWLMRNFGPLLVAVVFFVWRDYRREDRLTDRIDVLEDEQREVILPLVKETSVIIARNTDVMATNNEIMTRLERALYRVDPCKYSGQSKPCES